MQLNTNANVNLPDRLLRVGAPSIDAASIVANLTEDDAMMLWHKLREKFGWVGTFFTRGDAEMEWVNATGSDDGEMPDDVWQRVKQTWEWRDGIVEEMCEQSWSLIHNAVQEAVEAK